MSKPFERLSASGRVASVDAASVDAFVAAGSCLLFFAGDAVRRAETDDVAVVLEQLLRANGALRVGVVARADEAELAGRFGVEVTPSLVEVRAGRPGETVPRIQPWAVYARLGARFDEGGAP